MKHYAEISRQIREIFLSFTPLVEPLSLDEAFLDVHGCEGLYSASAPDIARQIKERIKRRDRLDGFGGRGAEQVSREAGQRSRQAGRIGGSDAAGWSTDFLAPLPVGRIWGVGAKGEKRLQRLGHPHHRPARPHCPKRL